MAPVGSPRTLWLHGTSAPPLTGHSTHLNGTGPWLPKQGRCG